jgi:nicotinamide-nucleotide amidase
MILEQPTEGERGQVDYGLVLTGGELLNGVYSDQHTQFLTRTLSPLGFRCIAVSIVGDETEDLVRALKHLDNRVRLIIVTGGLGPTQDDITRETLSEYTGIALQPDSAVLQQMRERYSPSTLARENVQRQALVPVQGRYLENPLGTAVGLIFDQPDRVVVALPGPPRELRPMVENRLVPFLAVRFGTRLAGISLIMRFAGIGESAIDEIMKRHLDLPEDLMISSLFEGGRVDLKFSLPENSSTSRQRLKDLENQLVAHLGDHMYSDDGRSLEEALTELLAASNECLATAEIGTGGNVAAALSLPVNSSSVLKGSFVAPSARSMIQLLGASSQLQDRTDPQSRLALTSRELSRRTECKWTLATSEVTEEENGRTFVWLAIRPAQEEIIFHKVPWSKAEQRMDSWGLTRVLEHLRKALLGYRSRSD